MSMTYFDNRYLVPSHAAMRELMKYGWDLEDCKEILEKGYDAPRRRALGTIERWLDRGSKTFNIVIVESHSNLFNEEIYLITHVEMFTKRKNRRSRNEKY